MIRRELATAVGEAVDPTSLMQRVSDRTLELISAAEGVAIGLVTGRTINYICGAGAGRSHAGATVDMDASLSGLAIQTGRILRSNNTQADRRVDATACRALSVLSLVCVPLSRSHEVYGVGWGHIRQSRCCYATASSADTAAPAPPNQRLQVR